jgi:hypothetical protein
MIDVHAPHETVHTWRDFFIHIATIVVGLLIAIGLEQVVEFFHHREQATHAREMLAEEIEHNRTLLKQNLYSLRMHEDYLFADLPIIARARAHKLQRTDRVITWHPYFTFVGASWKTIHESGAAAYFSSDELARYARAYEAQEFFNTTQATTDDTVLRATTVFYASAADRFNYEKVGPGAGIDAFGGAGTAAAQATFENQAPGPDKLSRLTPVELDSLQHAIQQAIYDDEELINVCQSLSADYDHIATGHNPPPQP